jgi:hypothetical protein
LNSFLAIAKGTFHYLGGEDSTFLVWNLRVQLVFFLLEVINGVQINNLLQMSDRNQRFLFLLPVIFIRIRFVIAKRLSRGFGAGNPLCAG